MATTRITDPFTGKDITDRVHALTKRLVEANRRCHAAKDPTCTTWEHYSIPARDPDEPRRTVRMPGVGCEGHGVFLSGADL
jgi:hypothetical protein